MANAIAGEAVSVSLLLGNVPSATSAILVAEIDAQVAWLGRLSLVVIREQFRQTRQPPNNPLEIGTK